MARKVRRVRTVVEVEPGVEKFTCPFCFNGIRQGLARASGPQIEIHSRRAGVAAVRSDRCAIVAVAHRDGGWLVTQARSEESAEAVLSELARDWSGEPKG